MNKQEELLALKNEILSGSLSSELAPFVLDGNDGKISEILYRSDIEILGFISSGDISRYLFLRDLLDIVNDAGTAARKKVSTVLKVLTGFDLSKDLDYSKFIELFNLLIADTELGFLETDKQALISIARTHTSKARILGINCSVQNIAEALRGGI